MLELFDSGNVLIAGDDDRDIAPFTTDSLIDFVNGSTPNPIPSPIGPGDFRLRLKSFTGSSTGPWAVDMQGPGNAFKLGTFDVGGRINKLSVVGPGGDVGDASTDTFVGSDSTGVLQFLNGGQRCVP